MNITECFSALSSVQHFEFQSHSQTGSQMNWHEQASGSVVVREQNNRLYFDETIIFHNGRHCHDQKCWQWQDNRLIFSRHRHGQYEALFEFEYQNNAFHATQPYFCAPDRYAAELDIHIDSIILNIYINSLRKNEHLRYRYFLSQNPF